MVGCAVVFDDARVIDGEIGGALLELGDGIAASGHEEIDEPVGLVDGLAGSVDEAGLYGAPLGDEALALVCAQFAEGEFFDAFGTLEKCGLCTGGSGLADGAVVLGTEAILQLLGAAPAGDKPSDQQQADDDDGCDDEVGDSLIHCCPLPGSNGCGWTAAVLSVA